MPRVSRKEAEQHRKDVVAAAARLFRERGFDGVSVPGLMAEAGLTHGAFYGHFASKDDLAVVACEKAFDDMGKVYDNIPLDSKADKDAARRNLIMHYTSKAHRDAPGIGCPAAAMAGDVSRCDQKGALRTTFSAGVALMIEKLQPLLSRRTKKQEPREQVIETAVMLVGAIVLSRATKGHKISEEILTTVRKVLLEK